MKKRLKKLLKKKFSLKKCPKCFQTRKKTRSCTSLCCRRPPMPRCSCHCALIIDAVSCSEPQNSAPHFRSVSRPSPRVPLSSHHKTVSANLTSSSVPLSPMVVKPAFTSVTLPPFPKTPPPVSRRRDRMVASTGTVHHPVPHRGAASTAAVAKTAPARIRSASHAARRAAAAPAVYEVHRCGRY
jgi:hypothetical protein